MSGHLRMDTLGSKQGCHPAAGALTWVRYGSKKGLKGTEDAVRFFEEVAPKRQEVFLLQAGRARNQGDLRSAGTSARKSLDLYFFDLLCFRSCPGRAALPKGSFEAATAWTKEVLDVSHRPLWGHLRVSPSMAYASAGACGYWKGLESWSFTCPSHSEAAGKESKDYARATGSVCFKAMGRRGVQRLGPDLFRGGQAGTSRGAL